MGFETTQRKNRTYMSLGSTKSNDNKVTSKFFVVNKKNNDGQYEKIPMVDQNNYPKPFYGFLTKITPLLDNYITRTDGTKVPNPKVNFEFTDDSGEIFVLDLPFISQDKRVSTYIFGFVNSLAWLAANDKLGYVKFVFCFLKMISVCKMMCPILVVQIWANDIKLPSVGFKLLTCNCV